MHILILGATGRTGRLLVKEALKRGHKVSVVVGHKSSLKSNAELVDVHEGTPLNIYTLANAMRGCEAVLSTLNISRISDFPWSKLRTSKDFLSSSIQNVLTTAKEQHINRIIVATAWGVAETRKDIPFWFRWLIDNSNIKYAYRDHARQEEMLELSGTKWTIIRPVSLTDSEKDRKVKVTLHNSRKPSLTISRRNVAHFMMDVLEKDLYIRECPVISERK